MLYILIFAAIFMTGCSTLSGGTKAQTVEDCVANLLDATGAGAVYLTRATKACSHIHGLDHDRKLESMEFSDDS
jgi:hypothetical protein